MPHVSAHVLNTLAAGAESLGVERDALLSNLPVTPAQLRAPDFRADIGVAFTLIEQAGDLSGDPGFGLRQGAQARPDLMGVVGHLMLCADDLAHSLEATSRFQRLLAQGVWIEPEPGMTQTVITVRSDPDLPRPPPQPVVEWILASMHCVGQTLVRPRIVPDFVDLAFPPAVSPREYEAVFGVPVRFEQQATRLAYPEAVMALPIQSTDHELFRWLEARAQSQSASMPAAGQTTRHRLYRELVGSFDGERPTLQRAARRLAMSPRSLQRRLLEEGTSFQEVLDDARVDVARSHLQSGHASVGEVGFLLGFSEASAFRKAFRRWTGMAPAEFRDSAA